MILQQHSLRHNGRASHKNQSCTRQKWRMGTYGMGAAMLQYNQCLAAQQTGSLAVPSALHAPQPLSRLLPSCTIQPQCLITIRGKPRSMNAISIVRIQLTSDSVVLPVGAPVAAARMAHIAAWAAWVSTWPHREMPKACFRWRNQMQLPWHTWTCSSGSC